MVELGAVPDDFEAGAAARAQTPHPLHERPRVAAIGPDAAQPAEARGQNGEQLPRPIAVLHVGGMDAHEQNQAQGIDQQMSFSSRHLLASIVAANSA